MVTPIKSQFGLFLYYKKGFKIYLSKDIGSFRAVEISLWPNKILSSLLRVMSFRVRVQLFKDLNLRLF